VKKLSLFLFIAFAFFACGKSKTSTPSGPTSSQWTINGTTYKGLTTNYNYSFSDLTSSDTSGNFVVIGFFSNPSANGSFTVINGSNLTSGTCRVIIQTPAGLYSSTGKTGDMVNVTLTGGLITTSFSGNTMELNSTQTTASGTVIQ